MWVPEWHKSHGLHAHFVVGRYIKRGLIEAVWHRVPGHGFVYGKLIGDLGVGAGRVQEARVAARYIAKYMNKDFDEKRVMGLHRYDVAQKFGPRVVPVHGPQLSEAIAKAAEMMGGHPVVSHSHQWPDWTGPSAVALTWDS